MRLKYKMMNGTAFVVLALAPAMTAHAQTPSSTVDEVVVTATKAGVTRLQNTPIAIEVVSDTALKNTESTSIRDLPHLVAGLQLSTIQIESTITLRGVGGNEGGEGDVPIYMDGVYLGGRTMALGFNFNDLERVEVVKGPQGTLYGRNSTGGAINLISKTPTNEFRFQNVFKVGNYNLLEDQLYVSGPIIKDKVTASFAIDRVRRDGYLENIVPGASDLANANRTGLRGQVRWEVAPNIVNTLRVDYEHADERNPSQAKLLRPVIWNSLANTIIGDFHKVAVNEPSFNIETAWGVSNDLTWTINDMFTLKSLTAYREDESSNGQDRDGTEDTRSAAGSEAWGPTGLFQGANLGAVDYKVHQASQEFNLLNKIGPFSGIFGLYYYNDNTRQIASTISVDPSREVLLANPAAKRARTASPRDVHTPVTSQAVFLEETYHATPRLGLTVGGRYSEDRKEFSTYNLSVDLLTNKITSVFDNRDHPAVKTYSAFTPKVGVNFQVTDDAMVYASATRGFKSGGFNISARSLVGADFGQETIWSYEVGAKTDWLDHRLRVNVAAFRNEWEGLQFAAVISQNPPTTAVSNAAAASINGLEADITFKPDPTITLTGSIALLDGKYVNFKTYSPNARLIPFFAAGDPRYTPAVNGGNAATYDASGKTLVGAPPVSLNVSAQKDFHLADGGYLYVRGEYQYTGLNYFDPSNTPVSSQPAYSLLNASVGYTLPNGRWKAALWGKNLADQHYFLNVEANRDNHLQAALGNPRTFGLTITYDY